MLFDPLAKRVAEELGEELDAVRAQRDALLKAAKALYGCRAEEVAMRWDTLTKAIQAAERQREVG